MDILLLNPPSPDTSWYRTEHLGIAYLATVLRREGHNVHLLDANLEGWNVPQTYCAVHRFRKIDILGVTATEPQTFQSGIEVMRMLRRDGLDAHITVGGYFPTFWCDEILRKFPEVDSAVVGEGEETIRDLVSALQHKTELRQVSGLVHRTNNNNIVHNQPRPLIRHLDQLPFPARDYLPVAYQQYHVATIYSSRGCHHRCSFCQVSSFYRLSSGSPYRSRSAGNIAEELEVLVNEHRVRFVFFVDDEFIAGTRRRKRVLEELIHEIRRRQLDLSFAIQYRADNGDQENLLRELKSVGLTTVFIGVESGLDSILERFEKRINRASIQRALRIARDLDLNLIVGYILFNPSTTFEELQQSIEYLLSPESPTVLDLHGMILLKGTPEEANLQKQSLLMERDFSLSYHISDKKVAFFEDLLRLHYPIYRSVVLNVYKLYFLLSNLPQAERFDHMQEMRLVEQRLRYYHQQFLSKAIDDLSRGKSGGGAWIDDLKMAYQSLHVETQRLVREWAGVVSVAADTTSAN